MDDPDCSECAQGFTGPAFIRICAPEHAAHSQSAEDSQTGVASSSEARQVTNTTTLSSIKNRVSVGTLLDSKRKHRSR